MNAVVTKSFEPVIGQEVFSSPNYSATVCTITEESGNELVVYGIFNIDTGVREAELRGLPHAIQWVNSLQSQLDAALEVKAADEDMAAAVEGTEASEEAPEPSAEEANAALDGLAFTEDDVTFTQDEEAEEVGPEDSSAA